jgi:hypothetical protein
MRTQAILCTVLLGIAACAPSARAPAAGAADPAVACAGLPEADRESSPLDRPEEIVAVEELRSWPRHPKQLQAWGPVEGVRVTVRPEKGVTKEYLSRVMNCHVARGATRSATGSPTAAANPLAVPGATATVHSTGDAFSIEIRGEDRASSQAIANLALTSRPLSSPTNPPAEPPPPPAQ